MADNDSFAFRPILLHCYLVTISAHVSNSHRNERAKKVLLINLLFFLIFFFVRSLFFLVFLCVFFFRFFSLILHDWFFNLFSFDALNLILHDLITCVDYHDLISFEFFLINECHTGPHQIGSSKQESLNSLLNVNLEETRVHVVHVPGE